MPNTQPTAREQLLGYALAATPNEVTFAKAEQLADAYRDQVLTEAAKQQRETAEALSDGDPMIPGLLHAASLLLAARTTTAPQPAPDPDEWVHCARPHCPNGERHRYAAERGWQTAHMGTWQCPNHPTTTAQEQPR